ncbi:hypothetical protein IRZ59_21855 [Pseudomonas guariconensis]|uniref:hypothetical protein n=1 Tax=Pseudomonas guariconensis TaxID=1288410 RepID=UPI0018ABB36A|nr:hypothetical protein [Pseudomonas guariconensis]MBF8733078.1 hypothetical protein [Pseudomonas guariconensis]
MGALRAAQYLYDNAEPAPDDGQAEAQRIWIENGVSELMARRDVLFMLNGKQQGVSFQRFALSVDEHAMGELSGNNCSDNVLGRLVLAAVCKSTHDAAAAALEVLNVLEPHALLAQLAHDLLAPFAADGVLAEREDAANDQ